MKRGSVMVKGKIVFLFLIIVLSAGCHNNKKALEIKEKPTEKPIETCYKTLYEQLEKEGSGYYTKYYIESFQKGERNPSLAFEISLERKRNDLAECFLNYTDDKEHIGKMYASSIKRYLKNRDLLNKFKNKDFDINKKVEIYGTSAFGEDSNEHLRKTPPPFLFDGDLFNEEKLNLIIDLFYEIYEDAKIDPNSKNERMETPILFLLRQKERTNSMLDSMIKYLIEKGGKPQELYYEKDYPEHSHLITSFLVALDEYIPIDKPRKELYRFIYYSSWGRVSIYSLFINENDEKVIEAKKLDWDAGKIAETVSRKISDKEWEDFIEKTKSVNYWDMTVTSEFDGSWLDGEYWYFEGFLNGKHHFAERDSPLTKEQYLQDEYYSKLPKQHLDDLINFRSLCMHLVKLSGMELR